MPRNKRHFITERHWLQVGGINPWNRYQSGLPAYQEGGGGGYPSGKEPYQEGGFLPSLVSMAAPHVLHAGKKLACKGARAAVEKYCPPKKRKSESQTGGKISDVVYQVPVLGPLVGHAMAQLGLGHKSRTKRRRHDLNRALRALARQQQKGGKISNVVYQVPLLGPLVGGALAQLGLGRKKKTTKSKRYGRKQRGGRLQLQRQPWDPPPPFLPVPQSGLGQRKKKKRRSGKGHCFVGLP